MLENPQLQQPFQSGQRIIGQPLPPRSCAVAAAMYAFLSQSGEGSEKSTVFGASTFWSFDTKHEARWTETQTYDFRHGPLRPRAVAIVMNAEELEVFVREFLQTKKGLSAKSDQTHGFEVNFWKVHHQRKKG